MEQPNENARALLVVENDGELVVEVGDRHAAGMEEQSPNEGSLLPPWVSTSALAHISQVILTLAESLRPDVAYELVIPPGLRKAIDAGELEFIGMRSLLRNAKTKEFVANVPLRRIDSTVMSGLTNIPVMVAIHAIEMKLDALKEDVERILAGQHSDRVAHIRAGANLIEMAYVVRDQELKRALLQQAVVQMVLGRDKILEALEAELDSLLVFVERPGLRSTSKRVVDGLAQRRGDLRRLADATSAIARTLATLGEPEAARASVESFISGFEQNASKCAKLVRYIPTGTMGYPDDLWEFWRSGVQRHLDNLRYEQARLVASAEVPMIVRFNRAQFLPVSEV